MPTYAAGCWLGLGSGGKDGKFQTCADAGANLRKGILKGPTMPIEQCKQQLEHAAQFATPADLKSEVQKQLAPLDAGQRAAITAWASANSNG